MRATSLAWSVVAILTKVSLTVVHAQVAADYLVKNLPDLSMEDAAQLHQYAGHIALDPAKESNLFFWLVSNKHPQTSNKLVIWLNGGPGCSSADGYFLEAGPLRFVDKKLTINKGGWHEFANVVYLDQPVGTGLSYTSQQLLGSLPEFFKIFPERAKDDLYITGESYAGTYIPYFAKGILDHNANVPAGEMAYNIKGIAIGNGWIDPLHQYTSYIPFIIEHKVATPAMLADLSTQLVRCMDDIREHDIITQERCEMLVQTILEYTVTGEDPAKKCMNQYDIRDKDVYPQCGLLWPYELPLMKDYLTREEVKAALHASNAQEPWTECSGRVSTALRFDNSPPAITLLPGILEKINVMLFSGDQDLICNHVGTEYLISNMTWQGAQGFQDTPLFHWTVDSVPAGEWRQDRNLTYVKVFNASHMVPYDAPLVALDMINRFMGVDLKDQTFPSKLESTTGDLPPGGQRVDIGPSRGGSVRTGSGLLILVIMAVGVGIIVAMKSRQKPKRRDGDGAQWFPLNTNGANQEREVLHAHEFDELVVENGIHDSDDDEDDEDDEDDRNGFGSQSRRGNS
ncbi:Cell death protease [Mortierella sp. GBA43]|nr:Cell death protease [Mortierella sp. GBA43]